MTAPNTISLDGRFVHEEYLTASTIKPGYLVETFSDSGVQKVRVHSTAKGFAQRAWAVEDPLTGKTATSTQSRTIDDSYVSGEMVPVHVHEPGSRVYAYLEPGAAFAIGDKLVSAGDGTLQKLSSSDLQAVAVVEEAVDLSSSVAVATRTIVRVI